MKPIVFYLDTHALILVDNEMYFLFVNPDAQDENAESFLLRGDEKIRVIRYSLSEFATKLADKLNKHTADCYEEYREFCIILCLERFFQIPNLSDGNIIERRVFQGAKSEQNSSTTEAE